MQFQPKVCALILLYIFFSCRGKVQELESSDQGSDRYNVLQQEKLTLDGRVIQLESMIRQKDEVGEW